MIQEKIGKFIAKCRKDKKMTQSELAEKLNVTDRYEVTDIYKTYKMYLDNYQYM